MAEICIGGSNGKIQANSSAKSGIPVFKMCSYNLVTTYNVAATQNPTPVFYNASNPWMISAWTDVANSTFYPNSFINYFNQIEAQTGPLVIGDKIMVDNNVMQPHGTPNSNGGGACLSALTGGAVSGIANKFCLEYLGNYTPPINPNPTVSVGNYLWGGNFMTTAATIHVFSKFDCCKSFVEPVIKSTWDCVLSEPSTIQVSPENLFITYGSTSFLQNKTFLECVERFHPQVGAFPTLQACEDSCGSSLPVTVKEGQVVFNKQQAFPRNTSLFTITDFKLDLSDLPATSERRSFTISGDKGAEFKLEIKDNTTDYYYNFVTNVFQANAASLENKISTGPYRGTVTFPAVTGSDDQYDIYLYAKPGTGHTTYDEVRFGDGSIDINNSKGSNSLVINKVIYQYAALTLTLQGFSIGGTVAGTMATDTISVNRNKANIKTSFSMTSTAGATAAYRVLKQPVADDVIAFIQPVVGSAPIDLPGENIYPTARAAFTGDDVNGAVTSGTNVRMDATDISANIAHGDKITSPVTTDTVNGDFSGGATAITMDAAVATKMAVGDQVTGTAALDAGLFTVASIDSTNVFSLNASAAIDDGTTLTFSSKVNRSLTTVGAVFPVTATDFTVSQAIQFRDNQPLTFTPRMNYSWPVNNFVNLMREDMIVLNAANITTDTSISNYKDTVTLFEGTTKRKKIIKNRRPALNTLAKKPTVVKGLVTVQEGQVVFNKQQVLALAGDTLKIGGYGESEILRVFGWEVKFTDLAIALTAPTTTTTEAISANATIAVADREGIINTVSTVSGIGINPALAAPTLTTGGGLDGAGDWIMSAAQTLESGITLTVGNTGRVATITGNIEIVKAGTASQTLRFDINRLLSTSAP